MLLPYALSLFALLAAEEAPVAPAPEPKVITQYRSLDLTPFANADPFSSGEMHVEGISVPPTSYVFIEGESYGKIEGQGAIEERAAASAGKVLGGQFATAAGDAAEWYFDLPWDAEKARLYLRATRPAGSAFAFLDIELNGEKRAELFLPETGGLGDSEADFTIALSMTELGNVPMGRQALRFVNSKSATAINIDCLWIADGQLDLLNHLDDNGVVREPADIYIIVYRPGRNYVNGIPFDFIDPRMNERKGIIVSDRGPVVLPCAGQEGDQLAILCAGIKGPVQASATVSYTDGREMRHDIAIGGMYAQDSPKDAATTLGQYRYAYVAEVPIAEGAVQEVRIDNESGLFTVLAAAMRTTYMAK